MARDFTAPGGEVPDAALQVGGARAGHRDAAGVLRTRSGIGDQRFWPSRTNKSG